MSRRARVLAVAAAGAALSAGPAAWAVHRWATTTSGFAVRRVTVEGAVRADAASIAEASRALGRNALALDLDEVRASVLAHPWVASVRVRRVLPSELRLAIVERVPAAVEARGDRLALLDERGRVLDPDVPAGRYPLPAIEGAADDARRALAATTLARIRGASPRLHRAIERVDASRPDHLVLHAAGHPPLWASGPESADELAEYARRAGTLRAAAGGDLEYVDARWSDRLYARPIGS